MNLPNITVTHSNLITIIISVIIIVLAINQIYKYFNPPVAEGLESIEDLFNDAANAIKKAFEDAFNEIADKVVSGIRKAFGPLIDFFEGLPKRFDNLGKGINDCNTGLANGFDAIGYLFKVGGTDVGNLISDLQYAPPYIKASFEMESANIGAAIKKGDTDLNNLFDALKTPIDPYLVDSTNHDGVFDRAYRYTVFQMGCARKRTVNFAPCFLYYFLQAIGIMLDWIFVKGPIWIIQKISGGYDITCFYDKFFDAVDCLDKFWLGFSGYHLFHYSEAILNKCYYCDGMPHKGINDNWVDPDPTQPVLSPPDFPRDLSNAAAAIKADFSPDGQIPKRLKYMGRFLGNDTKEIDEHDPWVISEGIDPDLHDQFDLASANMKNLQNSSDQLVTDFTVNIPNRFHDADATFARGGQEIKAFFS